MPYSTLSILKTILNSEQHNYLHNRIATDFLFLRCLFLKKFIHLFIYFWLHWVFVAARRLSLVAASRGYSLWRLLLLWSTSSRAHGLQSLQFTGSRARAPLLWSMDLAAPQHVGSSWIRDWTGVLCTGKWTSGPSEKSLIFLSNYSLLFSRKVMFDSLAIPWTAAH